MTRQQMINEILEAFKSKQGPDKARWVATQLRVLRKSEIARQYLNLITNDGIKATIEGETK